MCLPKLRSQGVVQANGPSVQRTMKLGEKVTFRLYSGRLVEGVIRLIFDDGAGTRVRVEYADNVATIRADAIVGICGGTRTSTPAPTPALRTRST
jgi:hypothetical protein